MYKIALGWSRSRREWRVQLVETDGALHRTIRTGYRRTAKQARATAATYAKNYEVSDWQAEFDRRMADCKKEHNLR